MDVRLRVATAAAVRKLAPNERDPVPVPEAVTIGLWLFRQVRVFSEGLL